MKTNKEKIAIIGGGISGIASSVYLIEKGYKVDIYESKKNLGGRAGSINKDEKSIDIGQHVFLPSYKNFIEILEKLSSTKYLSIGKKLKIVIQENSKKYHLKSNVSIYPLNLIFSVLNYKNLKFYERLKIIFALYKLSKLDNHKSKISLESWLKKNNQNNEMIKKFWEIICIPAFNSKLNKIPINHAINLFKTMIFNYKKNIGICFFKKPFSEILSENYRNYIKKNNSNLFLGEKIVNIHYSKKKYLLEGKNQNLKYDKVILATNISNAINLGGLNSKKIKLSTDGIINIYFWFDKKVIDEDFISFTNSKLEWIFSDNKFRSKNKEFRIVISLSAVGNLIKLSNEKLISDYEKTLRKELNISQKTKTIKSLLIRSPKATQTQTGYKDLNQKNKKMYYVGDWTIKDLPNTMETAVLSSKKLVEKYFK